MTSVEVEVINRAGLHARPSAEVAKLAQKFSSKIELKKGSVKINAKSIMGVITLGATYKTKLLLTADGEDEKEAVSELEKLFKARFEENQIV